MHAWLARFVDVRPGEGRVLVQAFVTLFLILSGYTLLETARDALLLTRLPLHAIGIAYVAAAVCVLPASSCAARVAQRFGLRLALIGGLRWPRVCYARSLPSRRAALRRSRSIRSAA